MQETKEIAALFTLLDDPDEEVFSTVSERITHLRNEHHSKPRIVMGEYAARRSAGTN